MIRCVKSGLLSFVLDTNKMGKLEVERFSIFVKINNNEIKHIHNAREINK